MRTILFVHQSAEMYGSDKVLFELVNGLKKRGTFKSIVLVPVNGPLVEKLRAIDIETHIVPLVKVGRASASVMVLLRLPFRMGVSLRAISKVINSEHIDIVHSNTLAVISGAVWSYLNHLPHIWHVHEIILRPRIVSKIFTFLLKALSTKVICNSRATMEWLLSSKPSLKNITSVIHNGIDPDEVGSSESKDNLREKLSISDKEIVITFAGRINHWKGQELLIDAALIVRSAGIKNFRFIIAGSPPKGQEFFLDRLKEKIKSLDDLNLVTHIDFTSDMHALWMITDIAVVPSIEPEPFGMVALEAMTAAKPVIASNEGGLTEIVVDNETGILFKSRDVDSLAAALIRLIKDKSLRERYGRAGQLRAKTHFNMSSFIDGFESTFKGILNR
jgi:glycosyltransferase involved in cell wall biosynthesis